ncbi:hypothetical protein [Thermocatellispora tengchongensis]
MALGYAASIGLLASAWQVVLATIVISAGLGLAYSSMPALIMGSVPTTETAAANGLNALMRAIGTSVSSAVISVVLAQLTLGPAPSLTGLRVGLALAAGAALAGLLIAIAIPRPGRGAPSVATGAATDAGTHAHADTDADRAAAKRV